MHMWRKIDRSLRSSGLTVAVICLIGFISVIGTMPVDIFEDWQGGKALTFLLETLGNRQLFRTWWYTSLLAFLAFLMIYCSLRRLPSIIRLFNFVPGEDIWSNKDKVHHHALHVPASAFETVEEKIIRIFRGYGFRVCGLESGWKNNAIVFDKGKVGVLGPPLVHLGLVIAFLGGLATYNFGIVRDIDIGEGELQELHEAGAKVRLEKFSIIHHPGTREPEEYVSTLMVAAEDGKPSWRMLRVNQPVKISSVTLYQMRYRPELRHIRLAAFDPEDRKPVGIVQLGIGERAKLTGLELEVELNQVFSDFAIDSNNDVFSRSQYFLNPAAKVSLYSSSESKTPIWTGWAFKGMFPTHKSSEAPLLFVIDRLDLRYFSGIKLVKDPGVLLAYFGFLLLIVGSFVSCYTYRRFIRVRLETSRSNEKSALAIMGYSMKNQPDFIYEWKTMILQLQKRIEG